MTKPWVSMAEALQAQMLTLFLPLCFSGTHSSEDYSLFPDFGGEKSIKERFELRLMFCFLKPVAVSVFD